MGGVFWEESLATQSGLGWRSCVEECEQHACLENAYKEALSSPSPPASGNLGAGSGSQAASSPTQTGPWPQGHQHAPGKLTLVPVLSSISPLAIITHFLAHPLRPYPSSSERQLRPGSWDLDPDQVFGTLSPGPLHADSQILQGKWASPQNSVLQMGILCPHSAQVSFRENGKPCSAEPLYARKGMSSLPRSPTGPFTWYQWQQLTPASPGLLVNRGKRRPQATTLEEECCRPCLGPQSLCLKVPWEAQAFLLS